MAETFNADLKLNAADAIGQLRELRGEMGEVTGSSGAMGTSLGDAAFSLNNIVQAATMAFDAVKGFGNELERQAGIMNRFTGDISEAARRTNGLVSQLSLMQAQSRAMQAGLDLTADQFATLTVRATEYAAATGGDAVQAIDQLTQALVAGQTRGLAQFGINLEGITDQSEKTAEAIRQLDRDWGDAESSADTFGGQLQVLETRLADAETQLFAVINRSETLDQAFMDLGQSTDTLADAFGTNFPNMEEWVSGFAGVAIGTFRTVTETINLQIQAVVFYGKALKALADGQPVLAAGMASAAMELLGQSIDPGRLGGNIASATEGALFGGGGGGGNAGPEAGGLTEAGQAAANRGRGGRGGGGAQGESFGSLIGNLSQGFGEVADVDVMMDAQVTIADLTAQRAKDAEIIAMAGERELEIKQKILAQMEEQEALGERIATNTLTALENIAGGHKNLVKAGAFEFRDWAKRQAFKEGIRGAQALAVAIGNSVSNPPLAATKVAEAGQHFAIAAALGGAAAAAGAVGRSAGGGGGKGGARPNRDDGGGGGGDGGGGGTVVINFNSPVAEENVGAMNRRAERAASRRFDRTR